MYRFSVFITNAAKTECIRNSKMAINTLNKTKFVINAVKFFKISHLTMSTLPLKTVRTVINSKNGDTSANCVSDLHYQNSQTNWRNKTSILPSLKSRMAMAMKPLTIVVEGNIGSGKTTFLKHFKKFQEVCVMDEPVDTWRNVQGHNLLDLMYKDPQKWSLCFQSYVQLTMLDLHTKSVAQPVKLMERSIFSAKYCFVNNLREQGFLADAEHIVLSEWFDFIRQNIPLKVDLIVYLRTDPEIVFDRICKRGRSEENSISLEYLKSIHNLHEDWLHHKKFYVPCPVLTFDANEDLTKMARAYSACEDTFFKKISVAN